MFFRFGVAVLIVVAISLYGTSLESEVLSLKRQIIRQSYRIDVAQEQLVQLRLEVHAASSPVHLLPKLERGELMAIRPSYDDDSGKKNERPKRTVADLSRQEKAPIRR
ncbi:hypothetical protein Plim_1788 [Planctopirus limnophila DSM 3776]|uniref:Uncharacterized protein n=1 Tax=Planctopirus limnophila (strain ATCC 43296 / DSM 3776 / IFAM 1008 / Mu 290) TaxID=521674 RepID=D5SXQ1_PLAL2|nr:hypothetical protein [Planctopirus limnophila]ADG67618.1 hypothetical protein Plim_1788 [Planctopirus limnophila DSM 3776]